MATEETAKNAYAAVERVLQFDLVSLSPGPVPELSMAAAAPVIEQLQRFFQAFTLGALSIMPEDMARQVQHHADQTRRDIDEITAFKVHQGGATRDNLLTKLNNRWEEEFRQLHQLQGWANAYRREPSIILETQKRLVEEALEPIAEQQAKMDALMADATIALNEMRQQNELSREAAEAAALGASSEHFETAASSHAEEAKTWLSRVKWAGVWVGVAALIALFFRSNGVEQTAQLMTSKLLILGALVYWFVLCARNYSAHKHNEIINRHRVNALRTFRSLVAATGDQAKRDVVLNQAAECMFGHQETGYTKAPSGGEGPRQIVEFLQPKTGAG